jgi:hypothetical protein
MDPSIFNLIRQTLYPHLGDVEHVKHYPAVVGMRKRLFWLQHNNQEDGWNDNQYHTASKSNEYEVDLVAGLVSHLLSQGVYLPNEVTVLTPYVAQLQKLRARLAQSFEIVLDDRDIDELEKAGHEVEAQKSAQPKASASASHQGPKKSTLGQAVKCATVDNFQGEESKVIIISLVRCNDSRNCGFLRTSNRVNVLLSRAKHGMYIIGNPETYSHVDMWNKIITQLDEQKNIGPALELCCPRHEDTVIRVVKPEDFSMYSPEGGCELPCFWKLKCGHKCVQQCHSEMRHDAVRCLKPCTRSKPGCGKHNCFDFLLKTLLILP